MGNTFVGNTNLYILDTAAAVTTNTCVIERVVYFPALKDDDLVLQDAAGNSGIVLKAGASDASPVQFDYSGRYNKRLFGLTVGTIDGGTAYVYLK